MACGPEEGPKSEPGRMTKFSELNQLFTNLYRTTRSFGLKTTSKPSLLPPNRCRKFLSFAITSEHLLLVD
jgi:hypothetical protein